MIATNMPPPRRACQLPKETRFVIQALMFFVIVVVGLLYAFATFDPPDASRTNQPSTGAPANTRSRRTLYSAEGGCDVRPFEKYGGVAVEMLAVLYLFIGVAIVADDYFITSLEVLSDKLDMSADVAGISRIHCKPTISHQSINQPINQATHATICVCLCVAVCVSVCVSVLNVGVGATLMAMGSSAPELFTNVASVLDSGESEINDVGIGTIVGSALFNLLIIIGARLLSDSVDHRMSVLTFPNMIDHD
jgi:hypothetical protein